MVYKLLVHKKPRSDPLPDKPIQFPPLDNLLLELLENKRKIKKGLPPLVPNKPRRPPQPRPETPSKEKKQEKSRDKEKNKEKNLTGKKEPRKKKKKKLKRKKRKEHHEDDDLIKELGDKNIEDDLGVSDDEEIMSDDEEILSDDDKEGVVDAEEEDLMSEDEEEDPYAGMTPEEREKAEKEEYIWRFRILKKKYKRPSVPIPEFNEHSDLQRMKTSYDRTIRELYLDDSVEAYRTYLMYGFIGIEFVCTQWVGIDLSGFSTQQGQMMHKYNRLLIELGEKSYSRWGANIPVELRLIGTILMSAGMFYLGKIITSKFGGTVSELFKGITGQPPVDSKSEKKDEKIRTTGGAPKRKMRGPRIKPEDIKNMSHAKMKRD